MCVHIGAAVTSQTPEGGWLTGRWGQGGGAPAARSHLATTERAELRSLRERQEDAEGLAGGQGVSSARDDAVLETRPRTKRGG